MSQRSQVANSGSSPIEACSAACAAPGQVDGRDAAGRQQPGGQRPPDRRGVQGALGQVERLLAERLARGHPAAQEGHHLVGDPHPAEADPGGAPVGVLALLGDLDVGDLPGRGAVARLVEHHRRDPVLEVQREHEVGLALVQVDRALVHGAVRRAGVDGAEQPAGDVLDQPHRGHLRWSGGPRGRSARLPVGPVPARAGGGAAGRPRSAPRRRRGPAARTAAGPPRSAAARRPRRTGAAPARRGCPGRRRWPPPAPRSAPRGGSRGRCPAGRRGRPAPRGRPGRRARPGRPAATARRGCRGSRPSAPRPDRTRRCRARGRWSPRARSAGPSAAPARSRGGPRGGSRRGRPPPGPRSSGATSPSSRRAVIATDSAPRRERTNASVRTPSTTRSVSRSAVSEVAARRTGAPFSPR